MSSFSRFIALVVVTTLSFALPASAAGKVVSSAKGDETMFVRATQDQNERVRFERCQVRQSGVECEFIGSPQGYSPESVRLRLEALGNSWATDTIDYLNPEFYGRLHQALSAAYQARHREVRVKLPFDEFVQNLELSLIETKSASSVLE